MMEVLDGDLQNDELNGARQKLVGASQLAVVLRVDIAQGEAVRMVVVTDCGVGPSFPKSLVAEKVEQGKATIMA